MKEGLTVLIYHSSSLLPFLLMENDFVDLPDASIGAGEVTVGDAEEYARFVWSSDGTPTLMDSSFNVVTTDTLSKFCIFKNGTTVRIRNRLGSTKAIMLTYTYRTP